MDVLNIHGEEQRLLDSSLPNGGLPPAAGVHSFQVFRASADVPAETDQLGWTYHHHVDMARWKGRLYIGWNSCRRDEDVWPSRELYSTSIDGSAWSDPEELFPMGASTPLRMYFFRAFNDRMLAIAGLRTDQDDTSEDRKSGLVVREIRADHTLGDVFVLKNADPSKFAAPGFEEAKDPGFKAACEELLADRIYLEQQDRGRLLGSRRMKWHDPAAWPGGVVPGENDKWVFGKAFSFFRRPDNAWVGVCKMGWVTLSADNGQTWSQPVVPPSLVTGKAKVWAQRTANDHYVLVYNPSKSNRYPLVAVTSRDGINFGEMRVIEGELPIQRYAGLHRSIGPQYVRGISPWADDGSRHEGAMWLVYSMNKEDIWVSRVTNPSTTKETQDVADDFSTFNPGPIITGWNVYRPKWSSVEIRGGVLRLENRDPYDYLQLTRLFPASMRVTATFDLRIDQSDADFEIDLPSEFGSRRLIQLRIGQCGSVLAGSGESALNIGAVSAGEFTRFQIAADTALGQCSISFDPARPAAQIPFSQTNNLMNRIQFRTGRWRGIGGANPIKPGTDRPCAGKSYGIRSLTIERSRS